MSGEENTTTREKNLETQSHVSLRDCFASAALTGLVANPAIYKQLLEDDDLARGTEMHSETAYRFADAMLKARGEE